MNNHKSTQENNNSQNADCVENTQQSLSEKMELPIGHLKEEVWSFSKYQETGNTKKLINILAFSHIEIEVWCANINQPNLFVIGNFEPYI